MAPTRRFTSGLAGCKVSVHPGTDTQDHRNMAPVYDMPSSTRQKKTLSSVSCSGFAASHCRPRAKHPHLMLFSNFSYPMQQRIRTTSAFCWWQLSPTHQKVAEQPTELHKLDSRSASIMPGSCRCRSDPPPWQPRKPPVTSVYGSVILLQSHRPQGAIASKTRHHTPRRATSAGRKLVSVFTSQPFLCDSESKHRGRIC